MFKSVVLKLGCTLESHWELKKIVIPSSVLRDLDVIVLECMPEH